ncbi:hypothetical protein I6F35_33770 [Bradyrhizobium sp. BRP22]|uniref:hypothetical protein n=1 Tax=Bradyrhizobium sp. BRP22 TaxID=2793821 RepID=UPI001CD4755C|nr:hypothetical protein [Bradyrhizobium sp. BRP22]MCA1458105.1 hypothetical protein [Bradyrhizobium sp. BRP22]
MDLSDLISGNAYVGQNFPIGMPPAADGGDDPIAKLKELLQIQQQDQSTPSAPPTDVSARARSVNVPLPAPRPAGAPAAAPLVDPSAITAFAPTDVQRAANGAPPIPQDSNSLLSAITGRQSQTPTSRAMTALGGGLSTVEGNTAGGAFARGLGGGLKAQTAQDKTDFDEKMKAFKAVQDAQQSGTSEQYKTALTNYYKVITDQKNRQATAAASTPAAKTASAAPATKKAGKPNEISFDGDGSQGSPYQPKSKDDYDEIPSGTYYVHPSTGQLRLKK